MGSKFTLVGARPDVASFQFLDTMNHVFARLNHLAQADKSFMKNKYFSRSSIRRSQYFFAIA
jgi:hypothetical protein